MSNVAARAPGGRLRMTLLVCSNVPQAVGKSSESMREFTDGTEPGSRGYDMSCTSRILSECGFVTSPRGDVRKGPMIVSSSVGVNAQEYLPAACSCAMYASINSGFYCTIRDILGTETATGTNQTG